MNEVVHVIEVTVKPKTASDNGQLVAALDLLAEKMPSIGTRKDPESGELIVSGSSEEELEKALERLHAAHDIVFIVGTPQVIFRETLSRLIKLNYVHKRQIDGGGEFAYVTIEFEPLPPGSGFVFENVAPDGGCPEELVLAVERVIRFEKEKGLLAGFKLIDFCARLVEIKYHEIDSTPRAFEFATRLVFRTLATKGVAMLVEPIMKCEVTTSDQFLGALVGDLNKRRGHILGVEEHEKTVVVSAMVPMSSMFGYAYTLRSISEGQAQYASQFDHYEQVPSWTEPDPRFPSATAMRVA